MDLNLKIARSKWGRLSRLFELLGGIQQDLWEVLLGIGSVGSDLQGGGVYYNAPHHEVVGEPTS